MGGVCSSKPSAAAVADKAPAGRTSASNRRLSVTVGPSPAGPSLPGARPRQSGDFTEKLGPTDVEHGDASDEHGVAKFCAKSLAGKSEVRPPVFKENQDDFITVGAINGGAVSLYAALDGHGRSGALASDYCKKKLIQAFETAPESELHNDPSGLFTRVFDQVDQDLCMRSDIDVSLSGTTLVMLHKLGLKLTCANAGDSRCVLGFVGENGKMTAKNLSEDHKPENPEEQSRIEQSGGQVEPMHDHMDRPVGPHRVWVADEMTPGLAMSRSIGDAVAHSVGVSAVPEIIEHTLDLSKDRFMVLCSDGVWEFIESQEAVDMVANCPTPAEAADVLIAESVKRWEAEEEVVDDITAVVVYFSSS